MKEDDDNESLNTSESIKTMKDAKRKKKKRKKRNSKQYHNAKSSEDQDNGEVCILFIRKIRRKIIKFPFPNHIHLCPE